MRISLLLVLTLITSITACNETKTETSPMVVTIDKTAIHEVANSDEYDAAKQAGLYVIERLRQDPKAQFKVEITVAGDFFAFCMNSEHSNVIPGQACTRVDPKKYPNLIAALPDMAKELSEYLKKP